MIIEYLQDFNALSIIVRLLLAVLLSGLIGMERSKSGRAAGLRTHILVCLGATIASMTGLYINKTTGNSVDVTRIAAQVISGIGFLGAGTILVKHEATVTGLTTAACVWAVGTIGIAVGYGFYEAATLGTLLMFFITKTLNVLDKKLRHNMKEISIYVEVLNAKQLNFTLSNIKKLNLNVEMVRLEQAKTHSSDGVGIDLLIHVTKDADINEMVKQINEIENVNFAILTSG
jgi:putative Mg2+ transporter-C (MgtC) family protein